MKVTDTRTGRTFEAEPEPEPEPNLTSFGAGGGIGDGIVKGGPGWYKATDRELQLENRIGQQLDKIKEQDIYIADRMRDISNLEARTKSLEIIIDEQSKEVNRLRLVNFNLNKLVKAYFNKWIALRQEQK